MVISYVRRFLFVHVYKAAGMSIEGALRSYDVRAGLLGQPVDEQERLLSALGFNPAIRGMQRHVSALEIREAIGPALFAMVRTIHRPDIAAFGYADNPAAYGIA